MFPGFQKRTPVTVICGQLPSPKSLQLMKIKTACLRNLAIHPQGIWWIESILVTTAWCWVPSTKLQQLLTQSHGEGTMEVGRNFPQTGGKPWRWHCKPLTLTALHEHVGISGNVSAQREMQEVTTIFITACSSGCSSSGSEQCSPFLTRDTGLCSRPFYLLWEGRGEELSPTDCEAQKSSGRCIMETITISFLWGTRLSNIVFPFS